MPPQPGIFPVPHGATPTHTPSGFATAPSMEGGVLHQQHHQHQPHTLSHHHQQTYQPTAGPSRHASSAMDGGRKERRRHDPLRVGREMGDRRDDGRHYTESVSALNATAIILATRPEVYSMFRLRLYPLSLERSALIAQLEAEERYAIDCAQVAYDEERDKVEEEWKRGRERVKERLFEGIEERRRRAREEKEGEGIIGDATIDSHTRLPVTRKLRNKIGTSPPPTPHMGISGLNGSSHPFGFPIISSNSLNGNNTLHASNLALTSGPFSNPYSLSVDDLPSPFPLPLTSSHLPHSSGGSGGASLLGNTGSGGDRGGAPNGSGRRRVKGAGTHQSQAIGGLGKSLLALNQLKDNDLESDLGEIRRGNKRRRATAAASAARGIA